LPEVGQGGIELPERAARAGVHPERGQARRRLARAQPLERGGWSGPAPRAGRQRGQAEREPQADAIGRGLRRQVAEHDVQPAPRVLVAAEPPLLVGEGDGEDQTLAGAGGLQSV
jgi:hypothetical protein